MFCFKTEDKVNWILHGKYICIVETLVCQLQINHGLEMVESTSRAYGHPLKLNLL